MNPSIANLLVQQHINDLIQEAQRRNRYLEARRPRRIKLARLRLLARGARRTAAAQP